MKLNERQKLCATCDGRIPLDATLCPYCAAEQTQVYLQHKSIQESLTSLYPPLYAAKNASQNKDQTFKPSHPQDPMTEKSFQQVSPSTQARFHSEETTMEKNQEEKASFWPILLLSVGANLLVVGLLQLFFSDQGLLTLQWESRYWFVYLFLALPLFFLGFKKLSKN
jgi:hypothetical protein